MKSKVDEQFTANRHKRKRSNSSRNHFTKIVSAWKQEMHSKLQSDIENIDLPMFLSNSLSNRCNTMMEHLFKWIYNTWYDFPIVIDINLYIFHFSHVFWRSNGTIHDRKTYVSHLCYILENQADVINCIKQRYSRTYDSILKLIILHFEIRIHERF